MDEGEQSSLFRKWYKDHLGIIMRVARANAANPHDQEDLIQEISIQIWNSIPRFKGRSKESTYIYQIAINTAITRNRKEIRQLEKQRLFSENLRFMKQTSERPNEKLEWIFEQIRLLNPIDRSLILLHLDGQSYQEIAEILGISEKNVGVKLSRLRKTLTKKANSHEF